MRLRDFFLFSTALAVSFVFAGCSSNSVKEENEVITNASVQYQSETINGQVSEVNGSDITVTLGTISSFEDTIKSGEGPSGVKPPGEAPSGEGPSGVKPPGEAPSGEGPSGENPPGEAPSGEGPSGEKPSGEAPSGERPSGGVNMPDSIFTAEKESYNFSIPEESIIYMEQSSSEETELQGSLADIQEGSILTIEFDAEGNLSKITVLNAVSFDDMQNSKMPRS